MNTTIYLHGKPVRVDLTGAAERALAGRIAPLVAEVQLIFGCLIAKRVWFRDQANKEAVAVTPKLGVWFRPVRYDKSCGFEEIDNGAVASDYPLAVEPGRFVPDVVRIDHRAGKWLGDFTYSMEVFVVKRTA
jgi:hypothetical protein